MESVKQSSRIVFIDALKGLSILCVVYGHVYLLFPYSPSGVLGYIYQNFYLALFFFISGYFSPLSPRGPIAPRIWKKVKYLLVPTVACGLLYVVLFSFPIKDLLIGHLGRYKLGYWFTWTLFMIFLMITPLQYFAQKHPEKHTCRYVLPALFVLSIAVSCVWRYIPDVISNGRVLMVFDIIDFYMIFFYLPYFLGGMILREYRPVLWKWLKSPYVLVVACAIYLFYIRTMHHHTGYEWMVSYLQGFSGIVLAMGIGSMLEDRRMLGGRITRALTTFGRYSIVIYLIHFYFLVAAGMYLKNHDINVFSFGRLPGEILAVAISIATSYICIGIAKLLRHVPWLYGIFCGRVIE